MKKKKIWIFAGETSGDMYGARLAVELRKIAAERNEEVEISGMGSHKMRQAGVNIILDSSELDVMGLIEVLKHIFTFVKIFYRLLKQVKSERPDALVLIDYPGFNLRFAAKLFGSKIPVIWYISPHVWAWGKGRVPKLGKFCKKILLIFPFEVDFYRQHRVENACFVGHPLMEILHEKRDLSLARDNNLILLLPGSRSMEIKSLLLPMLESALELKRRHPELKFVLPAPRENICNLCKKIYADFCAVHPEGKSINLEFAIGNTHYYQQLSVAAFAASGTVTLESAIMDMPLIAMYKLNWITATLAGLLVKPKYYAMPNIVADKEIFKEVYQFGLNKETLVPEMEAILPGGSRRAEVESGMAEVRAKLSLSDGQQPLNAAAREIYQTAAGSR